MIAKRLINAAIRTRKKINILLESSSFAMPFTSIGWYDKMITHEQNRFENANAIQVSIKEIIPEAEYLLMKKTMADAIIEMISLLRRLARRSLESILFIFIRLLHLFAGAYSKFLLLRANVNKCTGFYFFNNYCRKKLIKLSLLFYL